MKERAAGKLNRKEGRREGRKLNRKEGRKEGKWKESQTKRKEAEVRQEGSQYAGRKIDRVSKLDTGRIQRGGKTEREEERQINKERTEGRKLQRKEERQTDKQNERIMKTGRQD